MARPTLYTPELFREMLDEHSTGKTITAVCAPDSRPASRTFYGWMETDTSLLAPFAHARRMACDAIADECIALADACRPGDVITTDVTGATVQKVTKDMIERTRLQIYTRLQLLAKWDPERYGDKLALQHDAVGNLADVIRAARERAAQG